MMWVGSILGLVTLVTAFFAWRYRRIAQNQYYRSEKLSTQIYKIRRQQHLAAMKAGYFEAIMRNNYDPIFTIDQDNLVMKVNQGAIDLFGFSQDDILGKSVYSLFYDHNELQRMLKKVETKGNANTMEIRALTRHGRIVHLNLSIARMDPAIYGGSYGGCVFNCQDISRRKTIEREMHSRANELERLAVTDALTGLLNRRQFEEDLKRFTDLSRENPGQILSLLVMDLDKFKQLNDAFGHHTGDQALRHFSAAILKCKREMDPAYRYGGDEFIMLLRGADETQAQAVAERIQKTYLQNRDGVNQTTVSIGIATFNGQESSTEFFQRGDEAMYRSKTLGGGGIVSGTDNTAV